MNLIPEQEVVLVSSNVTPEAMRDKMFDNYLNTQTEFADLIEVEIEFNNVDRVALFNIEATSIDLELTDDDTSTVVQTKTIDLEMDDGEYQQWVIEPMYIYANATLKISINYSGSIAKCGMCGIGLSSFIGNTQYSPEIAYTDYSIKATNEFGQTYLNPGNWAKLPKITLIADFVFIDAIYEDLTNIRGSFAFFEGNEEDTDYESLRVYGFLEDWKIKLDNPSIIYIDLDIQGAI